MNYGIVFARVLTLICCQVNDPSRSVPWHEMTSYPAENQIQSAVDEDRV